MLVVGERIVALIAYAICLEAVKFQPVLCVLDGELLCNFFIPFDWLILQKE